MARGRSRFKSRKDSKSKSPLIDPVVTPESVNTPDNITTPTKQQNTFAILTEESRPSAIKTPIMQNISKIDDIELVDQNVTLKSSEKPPENQSSYKAALITETAEVNRATASPFLLHKLLHDERKSHYDTFTDDATISQQNTTASTTTTFSNSVRMTMMFKLPTKKEGCSEDDAPITAIKKMNLMLKALTNKLPCRVGKWGINKSNIPTDDKGLYTSFPENIDIVESYVFNFNRFLSPGKTGYVRLQIFFSDHTNLAELRGVIAQFKKPREQFLEIAHSDAISPVTIGTLTGSVKAMAESPAFSSVMKEKFGLSELGLWFTQPRTSRSGEFNTKKFTLHLEIERKELGKRREMVHYFNNSPSTIDTTLFGTPLLLTKAFDYFEDDDSKEQIDNHARKQFSLGSSLRSIEVSGVQLCNWSNSQRSSTLHRDLMDVESITTKSVIKSKKPSTFKGRVFYAIIPHKSSWSFYFTKANYQEGRSIARGLPLFIRDHFHLDPAFFCSSEALSLAMEGDWNYDSRKFLSATEKQEYDKLDLMEAEACAETEAHIGKDEQMAMAREDDDISLETRLTKGDAVPPSSLPNSDEISDMTGSTRESKAKAYADKAVKEVAAQYSTTISDMQNNIGEKDTKITQLQLLVTQLQNSQDGANSSKLQDDGSSPSKRRKTSDVSSIEDEESL